ncbi:MAG: hypothetical protein ABI574_01630 [Burkholderiales bacterium]
MTDLLNNPAVQAGVVPFVVGTLIGAPLARTRYLAVAVLAGLAALLALTIGFSMEPFTSVKKLLVITLVAALLSLGWETAQRSLSPRAVGVFSLAVALAGVWMIQRVLVQQEARQAWVMGGATAAYLLVLMAGSLATTARDSLHAPLVGVALGWGSGALAVLGASGLLGQIGIALGTACAAVVLVQMVRGRVAPGAGTWGLPAAAGAGLVGVLACVTAELSWQFLLPLLLVPIAPALFPASSRPLWLVAIGKGVAALVPAALAVAWAYLSGGTVSPS